LRPGSPAGGPPPRAFRRSESPGPGKSPQAPFEDVEQAGYCRGFSDGEKRGYEQGERAGGEAAQKQLDPVVQSLRKMLGELEALRRREARDFERELVELALAVARKVVGQEVAANPGVVAPLLRDALGRLEQPGALTIRLNPDDVERLADLRPQLLKGLAEPGRVRFEADPSLSAGGCIIESEAGDVDARLEQRFRIVEEAFQNQRRADSDAEGPRG
jgi:flagellar assembly protein FliH